jgi:hypothetical protein
MVANQVIPSTNVKLVKGIQVELGLVIHQGKCIPWLTPNQFIIGWEPEEILTKMIANKNQTEEESKHQKH